MNPRNIHRGEIYYISLDPAFGMELAGFKPRPVVVVSLNALHETQVITVVPGTDADGRKNSANQVLVTANDVKVYPGSKNPITKDTAFQCHQMRAVSQGRFTQRSSGRVTDEILMKIEDAIRYCLGMAPEL
jgi:mRNA interferase MazF